MIDEGLPCLPPPLLRSTTRVYASWAPIPQGPLATIAGCPDWIGAYGCAARWVVVASSRPAQPVPWHRFVAPRPDQHEPQPRRQAIGQRRAADR